MTKRRSITALAAALLLQALSSSSGFTPTTIIGSSRSAAKRTISTPHQQLLYSQQNPNNDDNDNNIEINRRSFFTTASAAAALSSLLVTSSNVPFLPVAPAMAAYEESKKKQRILITGSNSGIGLDAAQRLALRGHEVVLACRTLNKATIAADTIKTNIANDSEDALEAISTIKNIKLIPMECDLADLKSIDKFVNDLKKANGASFDAVCYNAGLARNTEASDVLRTAQNFELTIGTNHLGHFYLNNLMMPLINKDTGRIVVTASSVHDPDSPGGAQGKTATLGDLKGLEDAVASGTGKFDMVDGGSFNADKAYKDSKLCNVLFTRELQRRLDESGSNIKVNSFTPGLIVSTGLFRDQNPVFTKLFDVAATNLLKVGETPHYGGGALEYMTLSNKVGEKGGEYYFSAPGSSKYGDAAFGKQFDVSEVSKEALAADSGKGKRFWELSEKLVGL
mmetsp:Transcript_13201/g.22214  ORF Transcript_13201/g.22214 Transcript_13201/m.22214 type:complete len:452 (-) Transcript_13201:94-1449(-)